MSIGWLVVDKTIGKNHVDISGVELPSLVSIFASRLIVFAGFAIWLWPARAALHPGRDPVADGGGGTGGGAVGRIEGGVNGGLYSCGRGRFADPVQQ